jgi:hypothetical protein
VAATALLFLVVGNLIWVAPDPIPEEMDEHAQDGEEGTFT